MTHHIHLALLLSIAALIYAAQKLIIFMREKRLLDKIPTGTFPDGPLTHERCMTEFKELSVHLYYEYTKRGLFCKVPHPLGGWQIILPEHYLREIKLESGKENVSFQRAMHSILAIKYTGNPDRAFYSARVLRVQVTKRLDPLAGVMIDSVNDYMDHQLPSAGEAWKSVQIHSMLLGCIARVTIGVFCGEELARDNEWVSAVPDFATDGWGAALQLRCSSPFFRSFRARRLPNVQRIAAHKEMARRKLRPLYDARMAMINDPDNKTMPDDGFQWMLESAGPEIDFEAFVQTMMRIIMSALHTTAGMTTLALADLLYRPELIPELVEELQEHLFSDETIKRSTCDKLRKMDSLVKESARFNPIGILGVNRKLVGKPFVFSDGTTIPGGNILVAQAWPVLQDPDHYEDPKTFKPWRFANATDEKRWQLANATEESLNFGYGAQACPGRWFASQEIKLILAKVLLDFDIKWDEERNGKEKPKGEYVERSLEPPTRWHMWVRRKQDGAVSFPQV